MPKSTRAGAPSYTGSVTDHPRIAIPQPCTDDAEYNRRAWPQYADAVRQSGGEPVEVPLTASPKEVADLINTCQAVLLPGSGNDVNPQRYGALREPETNPDDPARESVDDMLLQDAHNMHKPVFGICFGAQSLNVWRTGTLVQHLAPMPVNHRAGRAVAVAHTVDVLPGSIVAEAAAAEGPEPRLNVNSSHHQALGIVGDGLSVTARCPQDGVVEAVEGTAPDHYVVGVQWHPERTFASSAASRALFSRFLHAARAWKPREVTESVG